MERQEPLRPHRLTLEGRAKLTISGIEQVDCFDETGAVLYTTMGRLEIRGEGLHILELSQDGGELWMEGKVSALYYTDQPEKQLCAELLREKLLWCLDKEVPHGTAVEITRFHEREDGVIEIDATIYCEKASHKGIIIGKNGAMLGKVGEMARKDIESFLDTKVFLKTWVKVKENWRDSQPLLRNFGFRD